MRSHFAISAALVSVVLVMGSASPSLADQRSTPTQEVVDNVISDPNASPQERRSADCGSCDCTVTAHNPHDSHHNPGRTNAEARTTCKQNQPKIRVTAQLWEDRWWGWDRIGNKGDVTRNNKRKVSAFANDKCRNNKHRTTADSWVTFSNGNTVKGHDVSGTVTISC